MNSYDILHTVNVVAVASSNLRYCDTFLTLEEARRVILGHLESIRAHISPPLFAVLEQELCDSYYYQAHKINGAES